MYSKSILLDRQPWFPAKQGHAIQHSASVTGEIVHLGVFRLFSKPIFIVTFYNAAPIENHLH